MRAYAPTQPNKQKEVPQKTVNYTKKSLRLHIAAGLISNNYYHKKWEQKP